MKKTVPVVVALGFALASITTFLAIRAIRRPAAGPLTTRTTVQVQADKPWQDTGLDLAARQLVEIKYITGSIRDARTQMDDANGWDYICGQSECCEPLPDGRRSMLIARIGSKLMIIGNGQRFSVDAPGRLYLRINDCDEGLFDNAGRLEVEVSPLAAGGR